jgi:hypothetical protein
MKPTRFDVLIALDLPPKTDHVAFAHVAEARSSRLPARARMAGD